MSAVRTGVGFTFSREQFKCLAESVKIVCPKLTEEAKDDLQQEIALQLVLLDVVPEDLLAWAKNKARDLNAGTCRKEDRRQKLRAGLAVGVVPASFNQHKVRYPEWYPPHKDAEQFCPFPCSGARLMTMHEKRQRNSTG